METAKKIKALLPAVPIDMDGIRVKQAMPTHTVPRVDPFLLIHHVRSQYFEDRPARVQGIGPHPHRGFSPITFVIVGEVHHRDSRGNSAIATKGEVQWMHAGMGIIHSERPSEKLALENGLLELVQVWINSPATSKMKVPYYKKLAAAEIPMFLSNDQKISNKLIAGTYKNFKSNILTESELLIIWGHANKQGSIEYSIPSNFNTMLYVVSGSCNLTQFGLVEKEHLVVFAQIGELISLSCNEACEFILFAGVPINEKVSQSGPFVMNSQTEILEAMRDYKMGKMGILIEDEL